MSEGKEFCAATNCGHDREHHRKKPIGVDFCWTCETGEGWGYKPYHPFIRPSSRYTEAERRAAVARVDRGKDIDWSPEAETP